MSTQLDVAGILERAGADADAPEGCQAWALAQVGAAIAELVIAGRAYHASMCPTTSLVDRCNAGRRFEAALARFGGFQ